MMGKKSDAEFKITFDIDTKRILKSLGLNDNGLVQKAVDETVLLVCAPYVPMETGGLIASGDIHTIAGSGEVVYDLDNKARYLYWEGQDDWNWSNGGVQDGGLRGPHWFDRAMEQGGDKAVIAAAKEALRG